MLSFAGAAALFGAGGGFGMIRGLGTVVKAQSRMELQMIVVAFFFTIIAEYLRSWRAIIKPHGLGKELPLILSWVIPTA